MTWYSKLLAVVVFVVTFIIAFCLGRTYENLSIQSGYAQKTYSAPAEIVLSINQSAKIDDLILTLNSIPNDYRCPIDVQCIQAGAINANVMFEVLGKSVSRNMPSDEVRQEYEGYKISIVDINPPAMSKTSIDQEDYKITFKITK